MDRFDLISSLNSNQNLNILESSDKDLDLWTFNLFSDSLTPLIVEEKVQKLSI